MKRSKIMAVIVAAAMTITGFADVPFAQLSPLTVTAQAEDGSVAINETNFPDNNFRNYVLANFDTDEDGILFASEISEVKEIRVQYRMITDLKGVEYFTSLVRLDCSCNCLTTLDVSKNTTLEELSCNMNDIAVLDLSKNFALKKLICYDNKLSSLNISKNVSLEILDCSENEFMTLDTSKNTSLTELKCTSSYIKTFDISKNTNLTLFSCGGSSLSALDVSKNSNLTTLECVCSPMMTTLDISKNLKLENLTCCDCSLTTLDISKNTNLTYLNCSDTPLTELDVSNNALIKTITCNGCTTLTSLNLSNKSSLADLYCRKSSISRINLSNCPNLVGVYCDFSELTSIDLTNTPKLQALYCRGNHLTSLDISQNPKMNFFDASNNVYVLKTASLDSLTANGFNPEKASNWKGAEYNLKTNSLENITADSVTYDYDTGYQTVMFTLDVSALIQHECIPPTGVKATAGDKTVTVTWNAVDGATAYRVRRNDGTAWATLANVTATSYKDTAVTNGTKYTYGIFAQVNGEWSAASALVTATPVAAYECVPPTGVKATAGDSVVNVTWNAVDGATAYRVRRSDGKAWATLGNVTTTSYKDTAVTNGTKYTYGIFAQVNGQWSAASALVTATPAAPYECVPPTGVKATAGDSVVNVTWNAVEGATAYRVRRNDGTAWATLGNVTTTSYKDTAVTNGTKYTYGIFAQVNGTWSAASTLVAATPEAIECIPPASVTIKSESGKVSLEWSAVNGATKYRVRRSDGNGWTNLASVSGTSYTDTAVTNGTNYVYGIFAYVEGAWSAASALVQAKPAAVVSGVANGLTITTTADSITLSWDVVDGAEKYRVRRSDGVAWATKQTSAKTTFVDTDVVAGTTYKYSIYCYSDGAFGAPSSTVAAIL